MIEYKVGDRVRIRNIKWYIDNNIAGKIKDPNAEGPDFISPMKFYCGDAFEIEQINEDKSGVKFYHLKTICWSWGDFMFETYDTIEYLANLIRNKNVEI